MASAAVTAAVKARLATEWTRTPIFHPNEQPQVPADGTPFLSVQYPLAMEEQMSIGAPGNNVWREEGAIRFVLAIPRGAGIDDYSGWIDELRASFRGKIFSGVHTFEASPAVLDDRNEDGKYWALSCAVTYHFDIFG